MLHLVAEDERVKLQDEHLLLDPSIHANQMTTNFDGAVVIVSDFSDLSKFYHCQLTDQGLQITVEGFTKEGWSANLDLSLPNEEICELSQDEIARDLQLSPDGRFFVATYPEGTFKEEPVAFAISFERPSQTSWVSNAFFLLRKHDGWGHNYTFTASMASDGRAIGLTGFDSRKEWRAVVYKPIHGAISRERPTYSVQQ
jgi:hypothetical protein